MSSAFGGLNGPQLSAVNSLNGPMLVLAGAGTGKTKVITHRIANMVRFGVAPNQIVALTFTNKAAREMRERVAVLIGEKAKELFIGTFHSYCLAILKKSPASFDLPQRFTLITGGDQVDLVRRAIEERGWQQTFNPRDALFRLSRLKNSILSKQLTDVLQDLAGSASAEDDVMIHELLGLYDRQLRINGAIDFDDCILKVVRAFCKSEELRSKTANQVQFLMVDEYQDTNFLQLDLVRLIGEKSKNVCVVGDDDQSIYSWRGAVSRNIEMFEAIFPGTVLVKLEQNYRCTTPILNAANSVIVNNQFRKDKALWCDKPSGNSVVVSQHPDELSEATSIARKIMAERGRGRKYADVAVLYRMNAMSRNLEQAMRSLDIPYRVFGGQSFFEKKEVRDFLAYIKIAVSPHDRLALLRIINTPNRGIGLKTLEKICEVAERLNLSLFSTISDHSEAFSGAAKKSLQHFIQACSELIARKPQTIEGIEQLGYDVIKVSGLDRDIRSKHVDAKVQQKKLQLLRSLPGWLASTAKAMGFGPDKDLATVLDELLLDSADRDEKDETRDEVSLMTIHSSKGLEFASVYIVGVEDDILPHQNSVDEGKVDEERRLFYVAITRAKDNLEISYCSQRTIAGELRDKTPSRFLDEIDPSLIVHGAAESKQNIQDRKAQTLSKLTNFRMALK